MADAAAIASSSPRLAQGRVNPGAKFWPSSLAVARRTVRKFVRTPQLIGLATVQSAIFLVIFRYIFGGAINTGGLPYVDFLVPGFVTTGILFAGMGAASGVAEDIEQGLFDRLRSLPIPRASVLAGRGLADTALMTWSLAVGTALGFAVGFRMHGSVTAGLAAFGLCVLFSFAFEWVFITIGLIAGSAQAAQGMSVLMTLLVFVSSAYVPVSSMPGWLRPVAEHQPVTQMVNAVRGLAGGRQVEALLSHTTAHYVGLSLVWVAAIVAVFGLTASVRFSRR
jgi:ABC-2 type transport system permease protein